MKNTDKKQTQKHIKTQKDTHKKTKTQTKLT